MDGRSRMRTRRHVLLLAGGSGTRFWPMSRSKRPKQFLPLAGGDPLIVATWKRVRKLAPPERIWVAAPKALARDVRRALPDLRRGNLVLEPSPRDTAPAIALVTSTIARREPRAVLAVFPTDHVIPDVASFVGSVRAAVRSAREGHLVCLGVRPDRPATGFGYLHCAKRPRGVEAVPVRQFVEKPDERRARRFVKSGRYLWNAGMFVWRVDRFLAELERTAPAIPRAVGAYLDGHREAWNRAPRISVDYAVMEKAQSVRVVPLDAGWDDIGSWAAAARYRDRTAEGAQGHVLLDSSGSAVFSGERFVALVNVPDVVVVDTPDALLIVDRRQSERVRHVVEELRRRARKDLL